MRSLEVNRVLVTGKNRVRLGGAAVMDCLTWDGGQNVAAYQASPFLSLSTREQELIRLCWRGDQSARRPPLVRKTHHLTLLWFTFCRTQLAEIGRSHLEDVFTRSQERRPLLVVETWT